MKDYIKVLWHCLFNRGEEHTFCDVSITLNQKRVGMTYQCSCGYLSKFKKNSTDNCYLEYVEGYLTCTFNHKIGEECLMNK